MKASITKFHAAETQLERAVQLYLEGDDYLSAITLAGAADELLGRMLAAKGKVHALQGDLSGMTGMHEHMFGQALLKKDAVSCINSARDQLKHYGDGMDITMNSMLEAYWMIDRAVSNYWKLTEQETVRMRRFREMRCPEE